MTRCPSCGARCPIEAEWCSLCFTNLLAPVMAPSQPAHQRAAAPDPGCVPGWPCLRCGSRVPLELSACSVCGADFLAGATGADAKSTSRLDVVSTELARRPYLKVVVMLGGAAMLSVALAGVFWLASVLV